MAGASYDCSAAPAHLYSHGHVLVRARELYDEAASAPGGLGWFTEEAPGSSVFIRCPTVVVERGGESHTLLLTRSPTQKHRALRFGDVDLEYVRDMVECYALHGVGVCNKPPRRIVAPADAALNVCWRASALPASELVEWVHLARREREDGRDPHSLLLRVVDPDLDFMCWPIPPFARHTRLVPCLDTHVRPGRGRDPMRRFLFEQWAACKIIGARVQFAGRNLVGTGLRSTLDLSLEHCQDARVRRLREIDRTACRVCGKLADSLNTLVSGGCRWCVPQPPPL